MQWAADCIILSFRALLFRIIFTTCYTDSIVGNSVLCSCLLASYCLISCKLCSALLSDSVYVAQDFHFEKLKGKHHLTFSANYNFLGFFFSLLAVSLRLQEKQELKDLLVALFQNYFLDNKRKVQIRAWNVFKKLVRSSTTASSHLLWARKQLSVCLQQQLLLHLQKSHCSFHISYGLCERLQRSFVSNSSLTWFFFFTI